MYTSVERAFDTTRKINSSSTMYIFYELELLLIFYIIIKVKIGGKIIYIFYIIIIELNLNLYLILFTHLFINSIIFSKNSSARVSWMIA